MDRTICGRVLATIIHQLFTDLRIKLHILKSLRLDEKCDFTDIKWIQEYNWIGADAFIVDYQMKMAVV